MSTINQRIGCIFIFAATREKPCEEIGQVPLKINVGTAKKPPANWIARNDMK